MRGREMRVNEPRPQCWRGGGWERTGMEGGSSGGGAFTPGRGPAYQIVIITLPFELLLAGFSCLSLIHLSSSSS